MMYEVQKVEVSDNKGKASVSNVSSLGAVAWLDAPEDIRPILLDGVAHLIYDTSVGGPLDDGGIPTSTVNAVADAAINWRG